MRVNWFFINQKDVYGMKKKKKYERCKEIQRTGNDVLESSMH
jgi:hypothetical protein